MTGYGTVRAFVGPNGSGKTLAAVVQEVQPSLLEGRPVISNCPIHPEAIGLDPDLYVPLTGWKQLVEAEHATILLDEITAVLPSRAFASLPLQLQRVLNQLRKADVNVLWTAPNWSRCDVILREVTQTVTVCRGYFRQRHERTPEGWALNEDGRRIRLSSRWPRRKLFQWSTYDAQGYDDYQDRRTAQPRTISSVWYYRSHRKREPWLYRTLAPVNLLDHLDELGVCLACNKPRKRGTCSCSHSAPVGPQGHGG